MEQELQKTIDNIAGFAHELIVSDKGFDNASLEDAIEASGIDVKYFVDKNVDGFLKWNSKEEYPVIAVNANQPKVRQRFSMAHELGHLIMDWEWIPYSRNDNNKFHQKDILNVTYYRGSDNYSPEEYREEVKVNEFAAAFLMPDNLVKELVKKVKNKTISYSKALYELKEKSSVSMMAAGYRLQNYCKLEGISINE